MNALKHGLRAASVLLPGDDVEEFHAMRQEMFDLHKPRTRNEARCVEAMADHEWSMARCRRIRSYYQGKLIGLLEGTGTAHCEKDPHRWHHSAMDCSLDEKRIAKQQDWELQRLEVLQKLRRQNLIEAAEREETVAPCEIAAQPGRTVEPGKAVLADGDVRPTGIETGEAVAMTAEKPAMASDAAGNRENFERTGSVERLGGFGAAPVAHRPGVAELPAHFAWNPPGPSGYAAVSSLSGAGTRVAALR